MFHEQISYTKKIFLRLKIVSKYNFVSLAFNKYSNLSSNTNLYEPLKEFLNLYNFKIEFEKVESRGEINIIVIKHQ